VCPPIDVYPDSGRSQSLGELIGCRQDRIQLLTAADRNNDYLVWGELRRGKHSGP